MNIRFDFEVLHEVHQNDRLLHPVQSLALGLGVQNQGTSIAHWKLVLGYLLDFDLSSVGNRVGVLFQVEFQAVLDFFSPLLLELVIDLEFSAFFLETDMVGTDDVDLLLGFELNDPHSVQAFVRHHPSAD